MSSTSEITTMIRAYNHNIQLMLNLYRPETTTSPSRTLSQILQTLLQHPVTPAMQASEDSNQQVPDTHFSVLFETERTERTERRLTQREIVENTHLFAYTGETSGTCPISHMEFEMGDILCEMKECHHVFKYEEIMRWLDNHTTCPVCRHSLLS